MTRLATKASIAAAVILAACVFRIMVTGVSEHIVPKKLDLTSASSSIYGDVPSGDGPVQGGKMTSNVIPRVSTTDFKSDYPDLIILGKELGLTDDPVFFKDGMRHFVLATGGQHPMKRMPFLRQVLEGVNSRGGADFLIKFLEPVSEELLPLMDGVEMLGGKSLTDILFGGSIPSLQAIAALMKDPLLSNDSAYALAWQRNLLAKKINNTQGNAIAELTAIDNPQLKSQLEPLVLGSLAHSDFEKAAAYFLGPSCASKGNRSLATNIFSNYFDADPEAASTSIRNAAPSERRDWAILAMINRFKETDVEAVNAWRAEIKSENVISALAVDDRRRSREIRRTAP